MDKVVIACYFALALSLSQYVHSWYVKRDPIYRGKLGLGLPFFHSRETSYKVGYFSGIFIGIFAFVVLLLIMLLCLPQLDTLSFEQFLHTYLWIPVLMMFLGMGVTVVGPSATKIVLNATAVVTALILFYASSEDINFQDVLRLWKDLWPFYALLIGLGAYWITGYQRHMLELKGKDPSWIYHAPVIYYYGVLLGWHLVLAILLSVILALY